MTSDCDNLSIPRTTKSPWAHPPNCVYIEVQHSDPQWYNDGVAQDKSCSVDPVAETQPESLEPSRVSLW